MHEAKYSTYDIRIRAVRACLNGMPVANVAKAYQTHRSTVHRWVSRYENENGDKGLIRKPVSGRPRKLESLDEFNLNSIVLRPASDFGYETDFWTCGRLLQVIRKEFGIEISKWTIWRRLREAGLTYQKPERKYFEADEVKRQKWIEEELPQILETVKKYKAILYFEDESNISMTALLGKTWAPRGKTPVQRVTGKRGGISAMSAISKRGDLIFTLLEKRIASDEIIYFLKQVLQHHKRRHVVVVMDQARPHTSKKTTAFIESQKRLHVFYLPPYSPDWNPDEKVLKLR
jgi:transposase